LGLSVLIFRGGRHAGHEKTWEGPEHGNPRKRILMKSTEMYQNHICPDENGCILNKKMMPDITATVPELEMDKQQSITIMTDTK
jgi:hypothetical protein